MAHNQALYKIQNHESAFFEYLYNFMQSSVMAH